MYGLKIWSKCIDSIRCMDYGYEVNVYIQVDGFE